MGLITGKSDSIFKDLPTHIGGYSTLHIRELPIRELCKALEFLVVKGPRVAIAAAALFLESSGLFAF